MLAAVFVYALPLTPKRSSQNFIPVIKIQNPHGSLSPGQKATAAKIATTITKAAIISARFLTQPCYQTT